MFNKMLAALIMGIVVAVLSSFVVGLVAGGGVSGGQSGLWGALAGFVLTGLLALTAATGRYAWGRGMLLSGLLSFAMPLASIVFTIVVSAAHMKTVPVDSASQAGAGIGVALGGTAIAIVTGVVGFFMGTIFIIVAYFLLRAPRVQMMYAYPPGAYPPGAYPPGSPPGYTPGPHPPGAYPPPPPPGPYTQHR